MHALWVLAACRGEDPVTDRGLALPHYELVWRDSAFSAVTRPVADESAVYFFDYLHVVTAVEKKSGKVIWRTQLTYPTDPGIRIGFGMAIAAGKLVVGDLDVFGIDRVDGSIIWRFSPAVLPREQTGRGHLTTDGTVVYAGSVTGRLYAIDGATGVERWRSRVADSTLAVNDPVLSDGMIYVSLSSGIPPYGGGVAAVRAADGENAWITLFPTNPARPTGVETEVGISDSLIFAGAEDDRVVVLDRRTGAVRFVVAGTTFRPAGASTPLSSVNFAIASSPRMVVAGSLSGMVVGLDGADAHVRWRTKVDGFPFDVRVFEDRAYVAAMTALDILRIDDGSIAWSIPVTDFSYNLTYDLFGTAPTVDAERVYFGGDHGVYAFKKR
jgi:outer membrane protein assembly factor BamB